MISCLNGYQEGRPITGTHKMKLQQHSFDLIVKGRKRIEVRLNDAKRKALAIGDVIEFRSGDHFVFARVSGLSCYSSFVELLKWEPIALIDPTTTPAEQLSALRTLYPAEREALGALAITIEPLENGESRLATE